MRKSTKCGLEQAFWGKQSERADETEMKRGRRGKGAGNTQVSSKQRAITAEFSEKIRRGRRERTLRSLRIFLAISAVKLLRREFLHDVVESFVVVVHHPLDAIFQPHCVKVD